MEPPQLYFASAQTIPPATQAKIFCSNEFIHQTIGRNWTQSIGIRLIKHAGITAMPFEEDIKNSCQVSVRANTKAFGNNIIFSGKPQVDFHTITLKCQFLV